MNRLELERYHYPDVHRHIATIQCLVLTLCGAIRGGEAGNASIRLGKVSTGEAVCSPGYLDPRKRVRVTSL